MGPVQPNHAPASFLKNIVNTTLPFYNLFNLYANLKFFIFLKAYTSKVNENSWYIVEIM